MKNIFNYIGIVCVVALGIYLYFMPRDTVKDMQHKIDSVNQVILSLQSDVAQSKEVIKQKDSARQTAEKKAQISETKFFEISSKYETLRSQQPKNRKDSIVYFENVATSCDSLDTQCKKAIQDLRKDIEAAQGQIIARDTTINRQAGEIGALEAARSLHETEEQAIKKKGRKNAVKIGAFAFVLGLLAHLATK